EVNQVFFDDVLIPVGNRVGVENQGWTVAKALLEFERGGGAAASTLRAQLDSARAVATREGWWGEGAAFRRRWAELAVELEALDVAERQVAEAQMQGRPVGDATASRLKLAVSTLVQKISELEMGALGVYAAADQRHALGIGATAPVVGP